MQAAVIEYTRAVLGRKQANSREFEPNSSERDAAVVFMPEGSKDIMGGTMRLGARRTLIATGTLAEAVYGAAFVDERHRHRLGVGVGVGLGVGYGRPRDRCPLRANPIVPQP